MRPLFNALRSEELLRGIGSVLRQVAAKEGPLEEYDRSQALSAYSVTRLLAAEQAAAPALLQRTRQELLEVLETDSSSSALTASALDAIRGAQTATELGDAVSELLAVIPRASQIRPAVHHVLADMVDREVAALAAAAR